MATQSTAVELSADEAQARAEKCFKLAQKVRDGLTAGRLALWATAEALYEFNEEHAWTALGYERLADWLADPEVGITSSTYYRLVRTWRQLAVHRQIPPKVLGMLDASKVEIVLPSVETAKVDLDDALTDVRTLGARDLREKYLGDKKPVERPQERSSAVEDEDLDSDPTELTQALREAQAVPDGGEQEPMTRELAWLEVRDALQSGAPYPRLRRETLEYLFTQYAIVIERTIDDEEWEQRKLQGVVVESVEAEPEDELPDSVDDDLEDGEDDDPEQVDDDEYYDPPNQAAWEEVTKRAASRRRPIAAFAEEQGWKLVDKDNPKVRESWAA